MWLNQNTDVIKKAKAILYYEDFIGYILTGKRMVSYSSAARSMAFDIRKKEWSEELLGAAGISLQQMSVPVAPSTVDVYKRQVQKRRNSLRAADCFCGSCDQNRTGQEMTYLSLIHI